MYRICADVIGFTTGGTQRVRLSGGNLQVCTSELMLNEDTNSNMTQGITIQQGGADNQILTLKSTDVTHAFVDSAGLGIGTETDTFFSIQKSSGNTGGANLHSWSTDGTGMYLTVHVNGGWTTKATNQGASIQLIANHHDGANALSTMATDTNLLAIGYSDACGDARRFLFDKEGTAHADVGVDTYDDYCDIELLRGLLATTCDQYKQNYVDRFGQDLMYNQQWYEDNKFIGRCSIHYETRECGRVQQRAMVNMTGLTMLHHSTIIQMNDKLTARLDSIESRLALPEGK
jgi:hypothetical protein